MKVIILAGGFGTRLSEYTEILPKPMVRIGGKPILWHIMKNFDLYGFNEFYLALGYKSEVIKQYFINYNDMHSNFRVNLKNGEVTQLNNQSDNWVVNLIDTGINSMTGGRLRRIKEYVGNETCMITYGDGLTDLDLEKLLQFHKSHKKLATVTAVRPLARFGELRLENNQVIDFSEKPQLNQGWINGGYFVVEPEFFDFIEGDHTVLEREPLETLAEIGQLMALKHDGYWQCMDTKRDLEALELLWASGNAPWKKWVG